MEGEKPAFGFRYSVFGRRGMPHGAGRANQDGFKLEDLSSEFRPLPFEFWPPTSGLRPIETSIKFLQRSEATSSPTAAEIYRLVK